MNEKGGYPTAWIQNDGNDIAMLTVDIDGLPEGWSTAQGTQVILHQEVAGVPMSLRHPQGGTSSDFCSP